MYYLFLKNTEKLKEYKTEFDRVSKSIQSGTTPVYCELRNAKTCVVESLPYNLLKGMFVVAGAYLLDRIEINATISVAVVLVINNFFGDICNYIFTILKHSLRVKLCHRLGIESSEHNIAVMESMEYQSV